MSIATWVEKRLPVGAFMRKHLNDYIAPKNLNFWYYFGVFSLVVLVNQLVTGIWLTMYYTPTGAEAFNSVEHIMRHVHYGWLLRYLHSTGASAFFAVVYLHMYRGIMYGSYKFPRELLWLSGCLIFLLLMAEAFTGYVLPWGQMSYWASKVIVSLFGALPKGQHLMSFIQGDYSITEVTLHRFFSFHVIAFPLIIIGMVILHIVMLHAVGSNNPDGIDIYEQLDEHGKPLDGIAFHPYYTIKDLYGVLVFLSLFLAVVFYAPTFYGLFLEPENFIPANPLITPPHIKPVWYFSPFYAILRAVPSKPLGALAMFAAVFMLFLLPWLDRSPVRSIRYKGFASKLALIVFVVSFSFLGLLGTLPATDLYVILARIFTAGYFLCFILMPWYTKFEATKQLPKRLTMGDR